MIHESIVKIDKRLSELEGLVKNCDKESMATVSIISHSLGRLDIEKMHVEYSSRLKRLADNIRNFQENCNCSIVRK